MDEPVDPVDLPEIRLSRAAIDALRARGGNLFVWSDKAGLLRARASPPTEPIGFDIVVVEGCWIHLEQGIAPFVSGWFWWITWRRLPWPHFAATSAHKRSTAGDLVDEIPEGAWWRLWDWL